MPQVDPAKKARLLAALHRDMDERQQGYRWRALSLFPHVCALCGREFSGRRMRELTVHHKDHNHENNPPDGSNWELLCIYCHDDAHAPDQIRAMGDGPAGVGVTERSPIVTPFEGLDGLLKAPADKSSVPPEKPKA